MKKVAMVIGYIGLAVVVFIAASLGSSWMKGHKLQTESREYVESTIPALLSNFTTDNILTFVADENKAKLNRANLDAFTAGAKAHWGQYKSYDSLKGHVMINPHENTVRAEYVAKVNFEKASPVMRIMIVKANDKWSLLKFDFPHPKGEAARGQAPASAPAQAQAPAAVPAQAPAMAPAPAQAQVPAAVPAPQSAAPAQMAPVQAPATTAPAMAPVPAQAAPAQAPVAPAPSQPSATAPR